MWDDVGILRNAQGLKRGIAALDALASDIADCGVADSDRRYNLTWMDRLNLESLTLVSRAVAAAADFRRDSRGAHFREDFPASSDLTTSAYTCARLSGEQIAVTTEPVAFTRLRPGETLLKPQAAE
jgi:fumarate reductase flavoprotein subunit